MRQLQAGGPVVIKRIRYIKPTLTEDTDLAEVSIYARYFYSNLWCRTDINGITEDNPKLLKKEIFPYDDEMTSLKVEKIITELVDHGFLEQFACDDKAYLFCPTLAGHQHFHKNEKPYYSDNIVAALEQHRTSTVLAPEQHGASTMPAGLVMGNGLMGNGERVITAVELEGSTIGAVEALRGDDLVEKALSKAKHTTQILWLKSYEADWIKTEIIKALAWLDVNPRKKPKSFAKFMGNWLSSGWEQHRKTIPSVLPAREQPVICGNCTNGRIRAINRSSGATEHTSCHCFLGRKLTSYLKFDENKFVRAAL